MHSPWLSACRKKKLVSKSIINLLPPPSKNLHGNSFDKWRERSYTLSLLTYESSSFLFDSSCHYSQFVLEGFVYRMYPNCPTPLHERIFYSLYSDPGYYDGGLTFMARNRLPINQMVYIVQEVEKMMVAPPMTHPMDLRFRELHGHLPKYFLTQYKSKSCGARANNVPW